MQVVIPLYIYSLYIGPIYRLYIQWLYLDVISFRTMKILKDIEIVELLL